MNDLLKIELKDKELEILNDIYSLEDILEDDALSKHTRATIILLLSGLKDQLKIIENVLNESY